MQTNRPDEPAPPAVPPTARAGQPAHEAGPQPAAAGGPEAVRIGVATSGNGQINLCVIPGWGNLDRPERFARERFAALCAPIP